MAEKDWKNQLTQILERLSLLEEKYEGLGQDMLSYLDGLYYSNGLTYWEYIHLDSLLGLQMPRTPFKDEIIFITYHQITELQFKLIKLELSRLIGLNEVEKPWMSLPNWYKHVGRMINYFKHLCHSFDIMLTGMEPDEFRKFRMALLPASGFQSAQIRHIEIMSTGLYGLTGEFEGINEDASLADMYPHMYWKRGGIDLDTGEKTMTLKQFESHYDESLLRMLNEYEEHNLAYLFSQLPAEMQEDERLRNMLREYDQYVNVFWKLSHLSAAARHLVAKGADIDATGGTNWRSFLPPRYQRVIFFKSLWTSEELDNWGREAVIQHFRDAVSKDWMRN